ncbi:MAG TPA: D-2-hydroxyacid dehydrogenase [Burkholderiaceae bacterium]|nr:D-2-hydroxyacid dehydrogenase [Burkholderiaceae bacterium]
MPDRFRLHIENLTAQPPLFHITPQRYSVVAARHPALAERIDVTFGWDGDIFERAIADAHGLIGWRFDRKELGRRAPVLSWIHFTGAGIEHVMPLDWVPDGAMVTNSRGVHAAKAGEFAAMAVLALNARLPFYATSKSLRRWERIFVSSVVGKTVVIVGVGHMGAAAAARCKAMGMRVLGIRASAGPCPDVDEMFPPEQLAAALPRADFLVLTVPLTPQTRGLIGRAELDLLKPECGVLNIARAGVVDYPALFQKLRDGTLSGAILDVFDPEPLPADSPAWDTPNLIMTPHVSSDDVERYAMDVLEQFFENFQRLSEGLPLRNLVDPSRHY